MQKSEYHQLMYRIARFDECVAEENHKAVAAETFARAIEDYLLTLSRRHKKAASELVEPYDEIRRHKIVHGYIMYL